MSYFRRNIDDVLIEWKNTTNRKPLLVRGARQIGKSRSIRHLGESFKYFIEVNFEANKSILELFEQESDVNVLCQRLSILYSTPIVAGETLLFFDEIQSSDAALKSLWFFKENLPQLHVIAAGSLLEFALKRISSYGVGRVSSVFMYPMSFNEFLTAIGKGNWIDAINTATPAHPLFDALHDKLVGDYRTFLMVGGMPASVKAWVETNDFRKCINELADIQQSYYDDFSKYSHTISPELLRNTLQSVISQTGGKFVYSRVVGGSPTNDIKRALSLMIDAGLIVKINHTAANGLPLGAEVNDKFSRYIYLDTGLLLRILDLDFGGSNPINELILTGSEENLVNKGKLAEMSVGWELIKHSDVRHRYQLFYWENLANGATSEVDFVIPYQMEILPIEVKSGKSGKMKSLRLFMQKKHLIQAIRSSLENFGQLQYEDAGETRTINIIPIYAIGRLTDTHIVMG
ncbi:MAG: ATP-binding protein [Bacteroidales bacterium]|nr:ATP-binding protein [Bacteroidales bacterium]